MRRRTRTAALVALVAALAPACEEDVVVGDQCPAAYSSAATVDLGDAGSLGDMKLGTSCAPCDGTGVRLDEDGCPIYVTWASCGGPICIGGAAFSEPGDMSPPDDDGGTEDEDGGND